MMGRAFMLMADLQSAQLHFMKVLQLIEGCGKHEMWMEDAYQAGERAL